MEAGPFCGWGSGSGRAFDSLGEGAGVWYKTESHPIVDLRRLASLLSMIDNFDNFNFDLYTNN